jgi:hypothetical protein
MNENPTHFGYITQSAQGIFAFPAYDKAIGQALLDTGAWATEEIQMISKLINPGDEVLIVEFIPHHLRYVAGVSPQAFAGLLSEYFNSLYIPSMKSYVDNHSFEGLLSRLYELNSSHDQIVFAKQLEDIQKLGS